MQTTSACISALYTENSTEAVRVNLMPMGAPVIMQSSHKKICWKALNGEAKDKEA
ncbi:MAG: hypothetical protein PUB42_07660 [Firmicutes bacterium]|nr:hypothetical protein [Bacillota bacterium]